MTTVRRVLVVCHGNINRSPLCEHVLRRKLQAGGVICDVRSAGFVNPGRRAAAKTRRAAEARGHDLQHHRSRLFDPWEARTADAVIYMDGGNYRRIAEHEDPETGAVFRHLRCLGDWADPPASRIPDPAFIALSDPELDRVYDLIVSASERLAQELIARWVEQKAT